MTSRTIFLQQNVDDEWFVRTGSSNGEKIHTNESYSTKANAVRAFATEGRHQPYAHMVVILDGQRPITVRAGKPMPPIDIEAEQKQAERIRAALAFKPNRSNA